MPLSLVSGPDEEPLSIVEAKAHLRVDVDDENDVIDALIVAARHHVEAFTRRALVTQTWDLKLCGFGDPDYYQDGAIWLPFPPVSAVSSVSYVDQNGTTQVWGSSNYQADLPAGPHARRARLAPAYGIPWPVHRQQLNAVTIRFVCGGAVKDVPAGIVAAMKVLVATWFDNRGGAPVPVPTTVDQLLWPFKAF